MPPAGGPTGPRQISDGPPSEQARAALAERLRREVADARLRFEEAGLRAETHRLLGQHDAAAEVLREQEHLLADLQDRLGRAVSAAVVERDAEQVLADLVATERLGPLEPLDATVPAHDPDPTPPVRARTPVLTGVTSLVAVLGLAAAAILGLTRGLDQVEVTEAAADSTPEDRTTADQPLAGPTPLASFSDRPGGRASGPATVAPPSAAPSTDPTPVEGPTTEDDTAGPSPTPAPPELATVVEELIDAVEGLGEPEGAWGSDQDEVPSELDSSIPGVDELVDETSRVDDGDPAATSTDAAAPSDGFVPRRTAE